MLGWRSLRDDDIIHPGDTIRLSDLFGGGVVILDVASVSANGLVWCRAPGRGGRPTMLVRRDVIAAVKRAR